VVNQSDRVVDSELTVDECDDFYISGELKTALPLMPRETYNFTFNVIPLQIGRLALPRFNLAEILEVVPTAASQGKDPQVPLQERSGLIKGLTKRCLVSK
jgi:hypothetical protein